MFIESKLIYQLIGEIDSSSIESKPIHNTQSNNNTKSNPNSINSHRGNATLQVFLDSNTLTLLNYSLLDSSLNIKLESNSKESQVILEKEQAQREQKDKESQTQESKDKESKDKESKDKESKNKESKNKESKNKDSLPLASNDRESQTQDSSLTASNDKSQSTSMLHPILEDNEIKCPHNGVVTKKHKQTKTMAMGVLDS